MGLFSRKDEDDFLTRQAKEEGRMSDFEQTSQAEIKDCTDGLYNSQPSNPNACRTHNQTTHTFQTQNTPASPLQSGIREMANQIKQELSNNPMQPIQRNNEPQYRQYRNPNQQSSGNMSGNTKKGMIGVGIAFLVLGGVSGLALLGIIGIIIIVSTIKDKNNKQ